MNSANEGPYNDSDSNAQERSAIYYNIPAELKALRQWVVWRLELRPGAAKPTKMPYSPWQGGGRADVTNPATWGTFEQVLGAPNSCNEPVPWNDQANCPALPVDQTGFTGIGFVFSHDDDYIGIDLDDTHGDIEAYQRQLKVFADFNSYTELSPSGQGVHIIVKGKLPTGRRRASIELYPHDRFFTMTGVVQNDKPIAERQELLDILYRELGGERGAKAGVQPDRAERLSDEAIVASNSNIAALCDIDPATYAGDLSAADQDLCNRLAVRSGNRAQVERIWLASRLGQRNKTRSRGPYREWTIENAFDRVELPPVDLSGVTCNGKPLPWNEPPKQDPLSEPAIADAGDWHGTTPPPRQYVLAPFIPKGLVTVLGGDGGGGKSLLSQQLASSIALSAPCLGLTPMTGTALIVNCEDDLSELHRREIDIVRALNRPLAALKGKLFFAVLGAGINNELAVFDGNGIMSLTAAFHWLEATAHKLKPNLIILDNVAHLFAGNENIRNQVAAFLGLLNALAGETGAAIVLIVHPNKAGDFSGSTAWNNQVRNRLKLEIPRDGNGNVIDRDARVLSVEKSNYSRAGQRLEFRWYKGAFVLDSDLPADVAEAAAANAKADAEDAAFLACLAAATEQKRATSHNPGANYAPTVFARMPEAKGASKAAFVRALDRLLSKSIVEVDKRLWQRENRNWKYGIKLHQPAAPTACTDPHQAP
jgi:RecA-family ATPase